ncbi:NUDIX domain-containing protein [Nonomuraea sp. NPDC050404]|uniref:NUDIX domain-containing protein n=1 Tax=Nonomuraea sp. NPDC050404 TaxID=3155783 RepID=UPI0033D337BA
MTDPIPAFSRVRIRTGALVFCGDEVALIRRDRPSGSHYTPPGGNVNVGEDLLDALRRELAEELRLEPADATPPELCWIQDQMVTRPGPTPPPRKIHMIFRCHITTSVRARLATVEYDELPDGTTEPGSIEWVNYRKVADLPLFPLIGPTISALATPDAAAGSPYLPPITDENYTWVI